MSTYYIQKQVRDERIVIEGGLICFTLVATHATPTHLETIFLHIHVAQI